MAETYYAQSEKPAPTMTVRQLVEALSALPDQDAPVIFKSPRYGCFGSDTEYSIDRVRVVELAEERRDFPACTRIDEETGEEEHVEAWTEVSHARKGVVIG